MPTSTPTVVADDATKLLDVLRAASCRLRMNEMADATGMTVARIGVTLQLLERRGHADFLAGRWSVTDRGRVA